MANYSSTQSGNWSDPNTWGGSGYPSANGDTATINSGHIVTFDTDLSGLTTGLGTVTVNGTLKFNSNTKIKMAGHFTGSGVFRCGEEGAEVENVWIYFNGNYCNQIQDSQYWGKDRTGEITGYLTQDYATGSTSLQVDRDMDIRVGDVICISASTIQGLTSDSGNPWGRGMYEVTNYNSATRTITITPALAGNNRKKGDFVSVLTREIRILQLSSSTLRVNNNNNSQVYKNCWFNKWGSGVIGGNNHQIISCAGSNNINAGICYRGVNHILSGIFTSSNNVNGGICYMGENHTLCGTFVVSNNTNGGIVCWGHGQTLSGTFMSSNNTNNGISYQGYSHVLSGTFTASNNNGGGISNYGVGHILSGVFTTSNNANGGVCYYGMNNILSGSFTVAESTSISYGVHYISGSFNNTNLLYRISTYSRPWLQTVWLNYDGERLHRIFCYAGQIQTLADLSGIKFVLEDGDEYMIYDIPFCAQYTTFKFSQEVSKNVSMSYLPRIQLIDPNVDPLKTTTGTPIDEDIMTDSINTTETLKISANNLTIGKRYVVRLIAKNGSGEVTWLGRDIAETSYFYQLQQNRKFDSIEG